MIKLHTSHGTITVELFADKIAEEEGGERIAGLGRRFEQGTRKIAAARKALACWTRNLKPPDGVLR